MFVPARLAAWRLQFPIGTMARREGTRRSICSVCLKPVAENEPHYRAGIAWFHIKCYEKVKPPSKRRPS